MATAKSGRYWVGVYTSPKSSDAVKWIAKTNSLVEARQIAHQGVVQSKYARAYRVIDTSESEIDPRYYPNGYLGFDIYYNGRFGCIVAEWINGDIEDVHIYISANGKIGKALRHY